MKLPFIKVSLILPAFLLLHAEEPVSQSPSTQESTQATTAKSSETPLASQSQIDATARAIAAKAGLGVDSDLYQKLRATLQKSLVDKSGTYSFSLGAEGALNRTDTRLTTNDKLKTDRSFGVDYGVTAGIDYNFSNSHAIEASLFLGKGSRFSPQDKAPYRLGVRDITITYSSIKTGFDIDYKYRLTSDIQLSAGLGFRRSNFTADSSSFDKRPLGFIHYYDDSTANPTPLPSHFTAYYIKDADRQLQSQVGSYWASGAPARKAAASMLAAVAEAVSNLGGTRSDSAVNSETYFRSMRLSDEGKIIKTPLLKNGSSSTLEDTKTKGMSDKLAHNSNILVYTSAICDYVYHGPANQACAPNPTAQDQHNALDLIKYAANKVLDALDRTGYNTHASLRGTIISLDDSLANNKNQRNSVADKIFQAAKSIYNDQSNIPNATYKPYKAPIPEAVKPRNVVKATSKRTSLSQNVLQPQLGLAYNLNESSEVYARYKLPIINTNSNLSQNASSPQYITLGYRYHF